MFTDIPADFSVQIFLDAHCVASGGNENFLCGNRALALPGGRAGFLLLLRLHLQSRPPAAGQGLGCSA